MIKVKDDMGKLKHCVISNTKDQLIQMVSAFNETKYGDKLIDFMDTYGLISLKDATVEQLQEYISTRLCPQEKEVGK